MKRKWLICIAVLAVVLVAAQVAQAMASANYRLDWFAPLTASGGAGASTNYKMNIVIGQTVSQNSASSGYKAQMGYMAGLASAPEVEYLIQLPLIWK
jgi:hypothetical protein